MDQMRVCDCCWCFLQCWESACVLAAFVEWAEWSFVMWGQLQPVRLKLHQWLGKLSFSEPLGLLNPTLRDAALRSLPCKKTGLYRHLLSADISGSRWYFFSQINMLICYVNSLNEEWLIAWKKKKRKLFHKWLWNWRVVIAKIYCCQ